MVLFEFSKYYYMFTSVTVAFVDKYWRYLLSYFIFGFLGLRTGSRRARQDIRTQI